MTLECGHLWRWLWCSPTWVFFWIPHLILWHGTVIMPAWPTSYPVSWFTFERQFRMIWLIDDTFMIIVVCQYLMQMIHFLPRISAKLQTLCVGCVRAVTTNCVDNIRWLEFQARYLSVWVGGFPVDWHLDQITLTWCWYGVQEWDNTIFSWFFSAELEML